MYLRPLNENLIIEPKEQILDQTLSKEVQDAIKEGRLILPEIYEEALKKVSPFGRILSWGNRCKYSYGPGDTVWFGQFSYSKLFWDDKCLWIVNEQDLHAKLGND